eukprot:m.562685 g.562685  ORF g.562685 m.562685 type:complete len:52 (+) comp57808_c0_seq4:2994-3149(+)
MNCLDSCTCSLRTVKGLDFIITNIHSDNNSFFMETTTRSPSVAGSDSPVPT